MSEDEYYMPNGVPHHSWNKDRNTTRLEMLGNENIIAGEKNIPDNSTPEQISSNTNCKGVTIQAKKNNTKSVYLGDSDGQYLELSPGESINLMINNLSLVYVSVEVDDEGINYIGVD